MFHWLLPTTFVAEGLSALPPPLQDSDAGSIERTVEYLGEAVVGPGSYFFSFLKRSVFSAQDRRSRKRGQLKEGRPGQRAMLLLALDELADIGRGIDVSINRMTRLYKAIQYICSLIDSIFLEGILLTHGTFVNWLIQ